ncbi:MAG: M48 family metallopeptidase [Gammaproteobacteria bacterium]
MSAGIFKKKALGFAPPLTVLVFVFSLAGCTTAPTLYSPAQMDKLGNQAYTKIKQQTPASHNAALKRYVQCVVSHLAAQTGRSNWQVTLFQSKEANAFALPGGKIGVYIGILKYADTQSELAAVIGHEMGHVLAHHINERMSREAITQAGLEAVGGALGNGAGSQQIMGVLGVGAQYGILLPFSRSQESQADLIGLNLAARAGFNPKSAIQLWHNMERAGSEPPQFLSDHPSSSNRIANLKAHMPQALAEYRHAHAAGESPHCGS